MGLDRRKIEGKREEEELLPVEMMNVVIALEEVRFWCLVKCFEGNYFLG